MSRGPMWGWRHRGNLSTLGGFPRGPPVKPMKWTGSAHSSLSGVSGRDAHSVPVLAQGPAVKNWRALGYPSLSLVEAVM